MKVGMAMGVKTEMEQESKMEIGSNIAVKSIKGCVVIDNAQIKFHQVRLKMRLQRPIHRPKMEN